MLGFPALRHLFIRNDPITCDQKMCWRRLWDRKRAPLVNEVRSIGFTVSCVHPSLCLSVCLSVSHITDFDKLFRICVIGYKEPFSEMSVCFGSLSGSFIAIHQLGSLVSLIDSPFLCISVKFRSQMRVVLIRQTFPTCPQKWLELTSFTGKYIWGIILVHTFLLSVSQSDFEFRTTYPNHSCNPRLLSSVLPWDHSPGHPCAIFRTYQGENTPQWHWHWCLVRVNPFFVFIKGWY